jgi:hypothetical protein
MNWRPVNHRGDSRRLLFLMLILPVVGCSDSNRGVAEVSGALRYKGQPLKSGAITWTVIFVSEDGQTIADVVGKDGRYTVNNLPAGAAKIAVAGFPSVPPGLVGGNEPPPVLDNANYGLLSSLKRFGDPDKSGLTCTVTTGKQGHDIELDDH